MNRSRRMAAVLGAAGAAHTVPAGGVRSRRAWGLPLRAATAEYTGRSSGAGTLAPLDVLALGAVLGGLVVARRRVRRHSGR